MDLQIRVMTPAEIGLAADWAAAEGWVAGLDDAPCFSAVDPEGFLIGELDGAPAATISTVNYGGGFSFLASYIVRPDLRGRGYGLAIWRAAVAHAGTRVIGLDGVIAQQDNYRKSGFALAHRDIRFGGTLAARPPAAAGLVPLADVPLAAIEADDATVFPAPRPAFWRAWIAAPGHRGRALLRDGRLSAWGVIRPCRRGWKIGPLVAHDRASAEDHLRRVGRGCGRAPSMRLSPTAKRSRSRRRGGLRRCLRRRACILARCARCGSIGCSASPRSNWDEVRPGREALATLRTARNASATRRGAMQKRNSTTRPLRMLALPCAKSSSTS